MPKILEGSLDPRVAPRGILFRHPDDQALNLGEDTPTASALARVRPLPHDELPVPPQDRVRRHDGRDLTQDLPPQPMPADRQASPVGVCELEAPLTQPAAKD